MKILTIIGARPQFIKAAVVSMEIAKHVDITEKIVHTGQHFDENMSEIFFSQMNIPKPNYFLNINSLGHGAMTGRMIEEIEKILLIEKPEYLIVYGDTNSTLAGALAASKLNIKVIHVEAGLRSFNMKMPEEINRILTDRISNILFCPTQTAVNNLLAEGFERFNKKIILNGDVMQDAAMFFFKYQRKPPLELNKEFVLCTIHRQENTDDEKRLKSIINSLLEISEKIQIVVPIHPRTKKKIESFNISISENNNIRIINPVGYLEMIYLINNCSLVMTDSGGLQKEAFFFKKPCVTLRDETEWIELIENGFNILAGSNNNEIVSAYKKMIACELDFNINLYGNGTASEKIINELLK